MGDKPTLEQQMATVIEQNKNQFQAIQEMKDGLKKHEETSAKYREKTVTNETEINNIKKESLPPIRRGLYGLYSLFGLGVLTFIGAVITNYLKNQ